MSPSTQPGSVPSETLAWIADQLEQAKRSGCRVIAVSHQNLLDHSSLISTGFTIDNAEAAPAPETEWPVLCHLSGHIHMQHMAKSASGLCDIATSSLAVSPNQYGVLTLSSDKAVIPHRTRRCFVVGCGAGIRRSAAPPFFGLCLPIFPNHLHPPGAPIDSEGRRARTARRFLRRDQRGVFRRAYGCLPN